MAAGGEGRRLLGGMQPTKPTLSLFLFAAAHKGVAPVLAARADFQTPERDPNAPSPQVQAAAAQVRPMDQPPPPHLCVRCTDFLCGVGFNRVQVKATCARARCCWLLLSAATCSEAGAAAGSAACKGCVCALGGRKPPADSVGWRAAGGMASCVTSLLEAKANAPFLF